MTAETPPILERALLTYARRFPLQKGKLRLVDHLWRAASGGQGAARVAELKYGGFKMPCDLAEALQRQFYFFGTYVLEEKLLRRWMEAAKAAATIFDVGANVGIYSLAALAARPDATVHAFEPTPELAAKLRTTARLNRLDRLNIHEAAVLGRSTQAILRRYRGDYGENEGMNYVCDDTGEAGAEKVRALCLDDFCRGSGIEAIELMKVDVQGQEHSVLQGAAGLIESGRLKTLFVELNWTDRPDCAAAESIRLLAGAGYRFAVFDDFGNWRTAGSWLEGVSDVVARYAGK